MKFNSIFIAIVAITLYGVLAIDLVRSKDSGHCKKCKCCTECCKK